MEPVSLEVRVGLAVAKMAARETHKQGMEELLLLLERDVASEADLALLLRALHTELHASGAWPQQARVELASLYGLLGEMFGASLGAAHVPRMVGALTGRLQVDSDSKVVAAVAEALGTLCAQVAKPWTATPCANPFGRAALLEVFIAPLFKLMREPHALSQAGAARALVDVIRSFPDSAMLDGAFAKIAIPLVAMFEQRDFAGRPHALDSLVALVERLEHVDAIEAQVRTAVLPACVRVAVSAMASRNEHEWAQRVSGARLLVALVSKLHVVPEASALKQLGLLQHDKVAEVRAEAQRAAHLLMERQEIAAQAALFQEAKPPPAPDATLAYRTPIRQRAKKDGFEQTKHDVTILVPRDFEQQRAVLQEPPSPSVRDASSGTVLSQSQLPTRIAAPDLQALLQQQAELLAAVNGLRKAVETGMRSLNSRVRTLEETLQDLVEAMDENGGQAQ